MRAIPRRGKGGNLIVLKQGVDRFITQYDFEEFLLLTRELEELENRWNAKRTYISEALKRGAEVEPGVHYARLKEELIVR
jgi:hypothetical protein